MINKILPFLLLIISFCSFGQDQKKSAKDSLYHKTDGEKIYTNSEVDSVASYKPNIGEMYQFVAKNINYPSDARDNDLQGKVYSSFIVEKNGTISDVIIIKSLSESCDNEVKRIISILPNAWTPALKNGEPVRFQFMLPISFKLSGGKSKKRK